MKSRNFSIKEIGHRELNDILTERIACFQMGIMQMIRDYLSYSLGTEVSIKVTSGYRNEEINKQEGGVTNSNHIWRLENNYIRCAGDYRFFVKNTGEQIPCTKILKLLEPFGGEIYHNKEQDIIHIGQQGQTVKVHFTK